MRRTILMVAAAAGLLLPVLPPGPADARVKAGLNVMSAHHRLKTPGGGVGSVAAAPTGAYSFRKLRAAYAGPAMRLRRASDNLELDIGFAGNDFNTAAATTHCAATSCFIPVWYDQSGLGRDLTQPSAAAQLSFIFGCNGTLPCARAPANGLTLFSAGSFAATAPVSLSAVTRRATFGGASPECRWINQNGNAGNRLGSFAAPYYLAGSTGLAAVPQPADNAWHAQEGVINGASSVFNVDGVETPGSVTPVATAGIITLGYAGSAGTGCDFAEAVIWDNYAMTPAERAALVVNQRAYAP
jgi:hypothetical protein